jgi:hypothetical protein
MYGKHNVHADGQPSLTLSLAAVAFKFHPLSEGLLINTSQKCRKHKFIFYVNANNNDRFLKRNVRIYVWNHTEFLHASKFSLCDIC